MKKVDLVLFLFIIALIATSGIIFHINFTLSIVIGCILVYFFCRAFLAARKADFWKGEITIGQYEEVKKVCEKIQVIRVTVGDAVKRRGKISLEMYANIKKSAKDSGIDDAEAILKIKKELVELGEQY